MITQYEAPFLLHETIPQMHFSPCLHAPVFINTELYSSINSFSAFTRHAIEDHNFNLVRKCFTLADKLYRQGDGIVRMLMENVFIYSFSSLMPRDKTEQLILKTMIPSALYTVYMKQVMSSGC